MTDGRSVGIPDRRNQGPKLSRKPGRNDSCPCGSGLKYKKCCGNQ
ncbi:SEC-C domain-containing protein [bacterium]|nr:SEC-C domain-containing protein [bacterium]